MSLQMEWQSSKKETDSFLKDYDTDLANITSFVTSDDNPRTGGAADDQQINVQAGYFFGVLLMLLFTYVISVFVVHGIEKESSVIGALYALGVKRRDLMMHYLTLPVIVTTVAGIIGFLIGISNVGIPVQMADAYAYYFHPCYGCKDSADSYSVRYCDASTDSDSCELLRYQKEASHRQLFHL